MRTFTEWIFIETNASKIEWAKKSAYEWYGNFKVGEIPFLINIYQITQKLPNGIVDPSSPTVWEVVFDQWSAKADQSLDFIKLSQLFQTLDAALVEFVGSNEVDEIKIHPQAIKPGRKHVLTKRGNETDEPWSWFDPAKFNAYLHLFRYSQLSQMGYTISSKGEDLIIRKEKLRALGDVA